MEEKHPCPASTHNLSCIDVEYGGVLSLLVRTDIRRDDLCANVLL